MVAISMVPNSITRPLAKRTLNIKRIPDNVGTTDNSGNHEHNLNRFHYSTSGAGVIKIATKSKTAKHSRIIIFFPLYLNLCNDYSVKR